MATCHSDGASSNRLTRVVSAMGSRKARRADVYSFGDGRNGDEITCALNALDIDVTPIDVPDAGTTRDSATFIGDPKRTRDLVIINARDGEDADNALASPIQEPRIVIWINATSNWDNRDNRDASTIHLTTQIGPQKWEHIALTNSADPNLATHVRENGLLPQFPTEETLRSYDDGSFDVRLVGYLRPTLRADGVEECTNRLNISSSAWGIVTLRLAEGMQARLDKAVLDKENKRAFVGPSQALGENTGATMLGAVATCTTATWVTGVAAVVRGRARPSSGGVEVEVADIEQTLVVATWLRLERLYKEALSKIGDALDQHDHWDEAHRIAHALHDKVVSAYGSAVDLLEIDRVVSRLEAAIGHHAREEVIAALSTRCRMTDEEAHLSSRVSKAVP